MPRKPSPERIFRSHHPRCRVERQKQNLGPVYFLVRRYDPQTRDWRFMYDGEGDTPAQAWKDACYRLNLTDLKVAVQS